MNITDIVHEIIDDEVIVANVKTGNYYSINGIGTNIWQLIQLGIDHEQITNTITKNYPQENKEQIHTSVKDFLNNLQNEQIIFPPETYTYDKSLYIAVNKKIPKTYSHPKLDKFTDMQALLQLDPIHEVDVTGWPNEKE